MPDPKKKIMVKKPKTEDIDIELTKKYSDSKDAMVKKTAASNPGSATVNDKAQGITIEKSTMKATPVKFKRVVTQGPTNTKITNDGKTIYDGATASKATQDAVKKSNSHETNTNDRRDATAEFVNINYGGKKDLSANDKQRLIAMDKAKNVNKKK